MKILKKLILWEEDYTKTENFLILAYRILTYIFPSGFLLWNLVIDKLLKEEVTIVQKIGLAGLFLACMLILVAVILIGRRFKKAIAKINDKLIDCTDDEKKQELKKKKARIRKWQEIYRNACIVAPFLILLVMTNLVEKGIVSFRGTLLLITTSLCLGFGFNVFAQKLIEKNK